ncbi:DUF502 domain-containing protein [Haloarchaeobius sp. DFWS5]|uniref:DUF502 domain-containing protein n=1 Tax=Haloarchaeobius sp. DFWS5 TaxID=3446114 RepID=UPI003EBEA178
MFAGDDDSGEEFERTRKAGRTLIDVIRDAFVAGLAVVVPIIVTFAVLNILAGYVFSTLSGVVKFIQEYNLVLSETRPLIELTPAQGEAALQILTVVFLLIVIPVLGFLTKFRYGEKAIQYVHDIIGTIPGIGSVYESFREMSEVIVESDQQNFRDVKLVEFPHDGSYTLGFLTATTPPELKEAAGDDDLVTLFLPLAPNPVMGGHLVHIPEDRVMDVDMTIEEGIRTVVTTGVASGSADGQQIETGTDSAVQYGQKATFEESTSRVDLGVESEEPAAAESPDDKD